MSAMSDRLKEARERRYKTAGEAAAALGVHEQTYRAHENGSRGYRAAAPRYARFFRVSLNWLMTGSGTIDGSPVQSIFEELDPDRQREALSYLEFLRSRERP